MPHRIRLIRENRNKSHNNTIIIKWKTSTKHFASFGHWVQVIGVRTINIWFRIHLHCIYWLRHTPLSAQNGIAAEMLCRKNVASKRMCYKNPSGRLGRENREIYCSNSTSADRQTAKRHEKHVFDGQFSRSISLFRQTMNASCRRCRRRRPDSPDGQKTEINLIYWNLFNWKSSIKICAERAAHGHADLFSSFYSIPETLHVQRSLTEKASTTIWSAIIQCAPLLRRLWE